MSDEPHMTGTTREYDVLLRLNPGADLPDDELAAIAESIHEAVETYAKSCVDGPAIGYTFEPQEIRLDFTTEASSEAEVKETIERVYEIILGETPVRFKFSKRAESVAR